MSAHFSSYCASASLRGPFLPLSPRRGGRRGPLRSPRSAAAPNGDSYLDLWRKAVERERRTQQFRDGGESGQPPAPLEARTERFNELLQVPTEERDRVQRLQVIDRAAAAIAAARALMKEFPSPASASAAASALIKESPSPANAPISASASAVARSTPDGSERRKVPTVQQDIAQNVTPGPDFWSWSPPSDSERGPIKASTGPRPARKVISQPYQSNLVIEKEKPMEFLAIPLQSTLFESKHNPPLPPLQSLVEVDKVETKTTLDASIAEKEKKLDQLFSRNAAEAAEALGKSNGASDYGVNPDGSKWWRETGIEQRSDGVVCKWTLTRGVSADETVEWEDKFWEAANQYDYKELGSEKSGRDASGNVWREHWKESMWQDIRSGVIHMEKTADKWGKNGKGEEWQEKWWEHYDASGQAEKWAHKWCCIDPKTPLEAGHAHVWHERWGEKYDGKGGSMKYTDKWAERSEGNGWSKWGDKWDEHFDSNGHGVKQGETWWEGQHGEQWNRTWGEQHNGSGWVHKYGKSNSGEHWDTHVQQETWYERHPHYGFEHCLENSVQLRAVRRPPDTL